MEYHKLEIRIPKFSIRFSASRWLPTRGNVTFTLAMIALLVLAQSVGALPLGRPQAAPDAASTGTIAYQGRLANAAGEPLSGTYPMIFRLYDVATGGTPLWTEQWIGSNAVRVSDGLFNVMLGSLTTLPQSVIAGRNQLFLGITVGTDDEMQPRVQLGSVPFAVQALTVPDGSVTTGKIADGAVTLSKLGEQPYFFHGAFATPSEWMADVIFNSNYARFCQVIGRTFVRADELQKHYQPQRGVGYFYSGWYYTGGRYHSSDTHVWGNGEPGNPYNVWKYNGGNGCCPNGADIGWTMETTALIWCR